LAIHLLVDATLSPRLVHVLPPRLRDVRVEDVRHLGYAAAPDDVIIALARERDAILLTEDRGFDLARNPICTHPGVVVVPRALAFPEVIAERLRRIWLSGHRRLLAHALTRLGASDVRIVAPGGETVLVPDGPRLRVRRES
jgi:predicted nuclease of predicted toxin-antitoxin system